MEKLIQLFRELGSARRNSGQTPAYVGRASFWGCLLGLFLGHLDLAGRLIAQNIEWFEFYLALSVPAVTFAVLFGLVGLCANYLSALKRRGACATPGISPYATSALFFALLLVAVVTAHLILYGDIVLWDPKRASLNGTTFVTLVAALIVLQARYKPFFDRCVLRLEKIALGKALSHYLFSVFVFCAASFSTDLYLLYTIPGPRPVAERPKDKPNVILISLDTVRADYMSLYGAAKVTTPLIDGFAKDSVVFERAYSTSNWTLPGHASMFTGKFPFRHEATENHQKLEDKELTLAEILRSAGYDTAGFIAGPYCKGKFGLGQGFDVFKDRLDFFESRHTFDRLSVLRMIEFFSRKLRMAIFRNDEERTAEEINSDVFRWLDTHAQVPFFLFINYFDVHDPYTLGSEFRPRFTDRPIDDGPLNQLVRNFYFDPVGRYENRSVSPELKDDLVALYQAELYFLDSQVGRLFDKLKTLSLFENTIIIITSDHGEEFFDHGGVMHKQTLYEEMLWVPLIVRYPKAFPARRVPAAVGLIDIMPTVLESLNLPQVKDIDGATLLPLLKGESSSHSRPFMLAERDANLKHGESDLRAYIEYPWKLITAQPELPRMPTSLFNLVDDPAELKNKFGEPLSMEVQEKLKSELGSRFSKK